MRYMLDTNICIYLRKAHPPEYWRVCFNSIMVTSFMSIITYAELRVGLEGLGSSRAQNERALHLLTQRYSRPAFRRSRSRTLRRANALPFATGPPRRVRRLIAAHAASLGLTLAPTTKRISGITPDLSVEELGESRLPP